MSAAALRDDEPGRRTATKGLSVSFHTRPTHEPGSAPASPWPSGIDGRLAAVPPRTKVAKAGIDWLELGEALFRNRLGWLVRGSLVFAVSPVVAWAAVDATSDPATVSPPVGAHAVDTHAVDTHATDSRPADGGEHTPSSEVGEEPPLGPTVRFGGGSGRDAAATETACHPSYTPCVLVAQDVDCIGPHAREGHHDGPAFVSGPLLVIGNDVYDLDANGDLVACYDGDR